MKAFLFDNLSLSPTLDKCHWRGTGAPFWKCLQERQNQGLPQAAGDHTLTSCMKQSPIQNTLLWMDRGSQSLWTFYSPSPKQPLFHSLFPVTFPIASARTTSVHRGAHETFPSSLPPPFSLPVMQLKGCKLCLHFQIKSNEIKPMTLTSHWRSAMTLPCRSTGLVVLSKLAEN